MEHETFWTLLHDPAHWQFEIFIIVIFDVIIGLILWPIFVYFIWPKIKKACGHVPTNKTDSDRIKDLEQAVRDLGGKI